MSFEILLDQERLSRIEERARKRNFYRNNMEEEFARNVAKSASMYTNLSPSTLIALNRAGASPQAFAKASELRLREDIERDPEEQEKRTDWWGRTWFGKGVMSITRNALILGDLGPETASSLIAPGAWRDPRGMLYASKLGTAFSGVDAGSGFFPSNEFMAEQERRAIEFRTTPETTTYQVGYVTGPDGIVRKQLVPAAITPGRALRDGLNLSPDSFWGNLVSGVVDALNVAVLDTTLVLGKPLKAARALSRGMRYAENLTKAGLEAPRGLANVYEAGKALRRVPDTAAEVAAIRKIRKATKPEDIAEVVIARAGNTVLPDAPRWLNAGEGTWAKVGKNRWEYLDDVDLEVLRGDLDAAAARDFRRSRTYDMSQIRESAEATVWNTSKAKVVLETDPRAIYMVRTLAAMDRESPALAHRIRRDIFRGKISMEDADLLSDAVRSADGPGAESAVKRVMLEMFDRLGRPDTPGAADLATMGGPVRQLGRTVRGIWSPNPTERVFTAGHMRRMFGVAPGRTLFVLSGSRARAEAIDNLERFIDLALPNATREERLAYINRGWNMLVRNEKNTKGLLNDAGEIIPAGGTRSAAQQMVGLVDEITARMGDEFKINKTEMKKLMESRAVLRDELRSYHAASVAEGSRVNLFQELRAIGLISDDQIIESFGRNRTPIDRGMIDLLESTGPQLVSDLFDNVVLLPDIDKVRGLTRNPFFAKSIGRISRSAETGEARAVFAALDSLMNDVWRKSILSQVGYLTRNLLEGQVRAYITGHVSLVRNPLIYASYVINSPGVANFLKTASFGKFRPRGQWDLNGRPISMDEIDKLANVLLDDLSTADEWMMAAGQRQQWDLSMGPTPESSAAHVHATGGWVPVDMSGRVTLPGGESVIRPSAHTEGMIDQLRKISMDKMQRIYMMFAGTGDAAVRKQKVLDWLFGTPEGAEARRELLGLYASGQQVRLPRAPGTVVRVPPSVSKQMTRADELAFISTRLDEVAERASQMDQIPELVLMSSINRIPVLDPSTGRGIIREFVIDMSTDRGRRLAHKMFGSQYRSIVATPDLITGRSFRFAIEDAARGNPDLSFYALNAQQDGSIIRVAGMEFLPDKVVGDVATPQVVWGTKNTENYADKAMEVIESIKSRAEMNYMNGDSTLLDLIPRRVGWANRVSDVGSENGYQRFLRAYSEIVFSGTYEGTGRVGEKVTALSKKFAFGRAMTKFEKIPFIRQNYYRHVLDNLRSLSREEALALRDRVVAHSRAYKMTVEDVMGQMPRNVLTQNKEASMWERLEEVIRTTKDSDWGSYKLSDLHDYAMARSVHEMKELFFDASTRTNFDANLGMRINLAFVAAWASIMKDFGVMLAQNPSKAYRFARATEAGTTSTINPDRREGAFSVDPLTGEYIFALPLYDVLAKQFGANAQFTAPLRGLNVGLQFLPAFNPVGNIAASGVLAGLSKFGDWGRGFARTAEQTLLPYGKRTGAAEFAQSFLPASINKFISAIGMDSENTASTYGRNYVEAYMVALGSGEFDVRNEDPRVRDDELTRLENSVSVRAFGITLIEAFTGFVGPSAGNARFMVETKAGEFSMPYLAKVIQDLRERDYETAIPVFLDAFGLTTTYLVAGKNRVEIPGLSPTEPFMEFQQKHERMFDRYSDVAGYLAPEGDVFEFGSWAYQKDKGYVEALKGRELVRANEYAIGAALYRAERSRFPTFTNEDQEKWLKSYREALNAEYPGYPVKPDFNVASFDNFILRIEQAIGVPEWKDLKISQTIKGYLSARNTVLSQLRSQYGESATLSSRRATPYRAQLREIANALIEYDPAFARIYDRQFSREVALVGEAP